MSCRVLSFDDNVMVTIIVCVQFHTNFIANISVIKIRKNKNILVHQSDKKP